MNTTPLPQPPRLACRVVRLSAIVTDRAPAGHLATCGACRAYFAAHDALDSALRREAPRAGVTPPASFEQNLLRAVRKASAAAPVARAGRSRLLGSLLAAATAVAVIAVVVSTRSPTPPAAPREVALAPAEAEAIVSSAAELSHRWWNSVLPSAGTAIQDNALQEEFASVYADARSAVDFLALNFLPTQTATNRPARPTPRSG